MTELPKAEYEMHMVCPKCKDDRDISISITPDIYHCHMCGTDFRGAEND